MNKLKFKNIIFLSLFFGLASSSSFVNGSSILKPSSLLSLHKKAAKKEIVFRGGKKRQGIFSRCNRIIQFIGLQGVWRAILPRAVAKYKVTQTVELLDCMAYLTAPFSGFGLYWLGMKGYEKVTNFMALFKTPQAEVPTQHEGGIEDKNHTANSSEGSSQKEDQKPFDQWD
jgi:hypothetical protein